MHLPLKQLFLPFLILSGLNSALASQKDYRAAAIIGDQIITNEQMNQPITAQLYDAEREIYELKLGQLKTQILAQLVAKDPLSQGLTTDQFVQKYITNNPKVTDAEIKRFIISNRIPKEKLDTDFRTKIRSYMKQQKVAKAINSWLDRESEKHGVIINLTPPERPRVNIDTNDSPMLGPENAPITIVEYSDFQCPYCAKAEKTVKQIIRNYPGKVKVVYKQYPLDFHKDAFRASEASLCANEQSSELFWKLHDYMLDNPRNLNENNLIQQAANLGAKESQFAQCLASKKYANKVKREIREGQAIGVQSTPMFFVNGITVKGAQPYSVFKELIDEELRRESSSR